MGQGNLGLTTKILGTDTFSEFAKKVLGDKSLKYFKQVHRKNNY